MKIIVDNTKAIMLISGMFTCSMVYAVFFPQAAVTSMFGDALAGGELVDIIVRSWGALITLVGIMLIYGAFRPRERLLILTIAGSSKGFFVGLLILYGSSYLPKTILPIIVDGLAVVLIAICLPNAFRNVTR